MFQISVSSLSPKRPNRQRLGSAAAHEHRPLNPLLVVTTNAQEDPRFQTSHSIIAYQIRSVLASPLIAKENLIGAIYVDTRLSTRLFGESDLALLSAMANQAAVAIQLARLYEDLQTRNLELQEALSELQAAQDELIRAERLSLVGRMASGIIHDLKNPMTTIKGYATLLGREDLDPGDRPPFPRSSPNPSTTLWK